MVSLCLTNTESCNWTYFSFVLTLKAYNQIWVITVAALAYTLIDTDYAPPLATETGPEDGGRDTGFRHQVSAFHWNPPPPPPPTFSKCLSLFGML